MTTFMEGMQAKRRPKSGGLVGTAKVSTANGWVDVHFSGIEAGGGRATWTGMSGGGLPPRTMDEVTSFFGKMAAASMAMEGDATRAAEALTGLGALVENELTVAPGLTWPSLEARAWVEELTVREDEGEVGTYWAATRSLPWVDGKKGGVGILRRCRTGAETYAWVPEGLPVEKELAEGSKRPQMRTSRSVLEAEERLREAIGKAEEHQAWLDRFKHTGPMGRGDELTCEACGTVTADEGIFAEAGEWCT